MRSIFISWLAVISPLLGVCQEGGPDVVNSSGWVKTVDNLSLEASVGEVAIMTLSTPNHASTITQGFLQPMESVPCASLDVAYYPNPTRGILTVQTIGCDDRIGKVDVVDVSGRIIRTLQPDDSQRLDLSDLSQGLYVLRILTIGGFSKSINIIKVSNDG